MVVEPLDASRKTTLHHLLLIRLNTNNSNINSCDARCRLCTHKGKLGEGSLTRASLPKPLVVVAKVVVAKEAAVEKEARTWTL